MYTKDKNGQYWFGESRMLVYFTRGAKYSYLNPKAYSIDENGQSFRNPYEPDLVSEYYPGPVGVVIAFWDGDQVRYGYSRANISAGDKFDRKRSLEMAVGRALNSNVNPPFDSVPHAVRDDLQRMYGRAKNYFKFKTQ